MGELCPWVQREFSFLRTALNVQLSNFVSFIARFLPLLNIVAVIFLGGFVVSYFSGLTSAGLGSAVMLWFLILNLIFINFVYGDGTTQYQFRAGLNGFVLISIILLNAFSVLSLYGIWYELTSIVGVLSAYTPLLLPYSYLYWFLLIASQLSIKISLDVLFRPYQ